MDNSPKLQVFYDGSCPICTREIGYYRNCAGAGSIDWVDVHAAKDDDLPQSLDRDTAMARFHVRTGTGELRSGADAFATLWRGLDRFRWIGRLFNNRPSLWMLDRVYDAALVVRPWLQRLVR